MKIEERRYQNYIVNKIKELEDKNIIVELDCGMGKRVIILKLIHQYPDKKILVILNSTSSLIDTLKFFQELGIKCAYLRSGIPSKIRAYLLNKERIVLTTPLVLLNTLEKESPNYSPDLIIINEVDKIVLRYGENNIALAAVWRRLFNYFGNSRIIGLSGTLRDEHVIKFEEPKLVPELKTIASVIKNSIIIKMDDLKKTDIHKYVNLTFLHPVPVMNDDMAALLRILSDMLRRIVARSVAKEEPEESLIPYIVAPEYRSEFAALAILRKFAVAMPKNRFLKMAHILYAKNLIGDDILELGRRATNEKFKKAVMMLKNIKEKAVVLTSFRFTAFELSSMLEKEKIPTKILTGAMSPKSKQEVLEWFNTVDYGVLIMTPVGERDIDLTISNTLVVFDTINTVKTMYQRIKRIRGGNVYFLFFKDTYEEKKIRRLINNIMKKYPWSVVVKEFESS